MLPLVALMVVLPLGVVRLAAVAARARLALGRFRARRQMSKWAELIARLPGVVRLVVGLALLRHIDHTPE